MYNLSDQKVGRWLNMEINEKIGAVFFLLAIVCAYFAVQASLLPHEDKALPRDNAVNESLVGKNIKFVTLDEALKNPLYNAILKLEPIAIPDATYFANEAFDGDVVVIKQEHNVYFNGQQDVKILFWNLNKTRSLPSRFIERHEIPNSYNFKNLGQTYILISYDPFRDFMRPLMCVVFFGLLGLVFWKPSKNGHASGGGGR